MSSVRWSICARITPAPPTGTDPYGPRRALLRVPTPPRAHPGVRMADPSWTRTRPKPGPDHARQRSRRVS
ncbi:hypothetical protein [Streptomyces sp. NPDC051636]|uniref:hypothetical protein n=1 Tax=Streptomyces sp. NPDC051636 TaxID=3365663 RepID=UPI0037BA0F08